MFRNLFTIQYRIGNIRYTTISILRVHVTLFIRVSISKRLLSTSHPVNPPNTPSYIAHIPPYGFTGTKSINGVVLKIICAKKENKSIANTLAG